MLINEDLRAFLAGGNISMLGMQRLAESYNLSPTEVRLRCFYSFYSLVLLVPGSARREDLSTLLLSTSN